VSKITVGWMDCSECGLYSSFFILSSSFIISWSSSFTLNISPKTVAFASGHLIPMCARSLSFSALETMFLVANICPVSFSSIAFVFAFG